MVSLYIPTAQLVFLLLCGLFTGSLAFASADSYPKTIEALQARYADEVIAHQKYGAFAEHAVKEDYPAIAHLFRALASAEAIHARNFARILRELGQEPQLPEESFEILSTREHLQLAASVEADEIDSEYPKILERIKAENHQEAIRFITYAWQAERQHRDLILKIKKAASWFFGLLVKRIEGEPTRYYVCQICGSTVTELPTGVCPVCGHAPSDYQEVPGFDPKRVRTMPEQPSIIDFSD